MELSTPAKKALWAEHKDAPKLWRYLEILETNEPFSTPKAVQAIYKEDMDTIAPQVLYNRFYKLRKVLRIKLLDKLKNTLKSYTVEEVELKFLQLLSLKNEHAHVLEKAQKLEKKCWEDNLFELLPDLIQLIINALHFHQSQQSDTIRAYIEKLELASKLQYVLYQSKNEVNSFRSYILGGYNLEEITTHYNQVVNKMRRRATTWKAYQRFSLIYHHISFTIGAQLQNIVHKSGNVLTRHLNQMEKILDTNPYMPAVNYMVHHRLYFLHQLLLNKAVYWYQKGKPKKSYGYILDFQNNKNSNPEVYLPESERDYYNILLCCWAAKQYQAMLLYTDALREFQVNNGAVKTATPYFVYEILAYTGLYPKEYHPNAQQLINTAKKFLTTADEHADWIYGIVGTFALLYKDYKKSRQLLEHPPLLAEYQQLEYNIPTIELLDAIEDGRYETLLQLIQKIRLYQQKNTDRDVLTHLEELERLTIIDGQSIHLSFATTFFGSRQLPATHCVPRLPQPSSGTPLPNPIVASPDELFASGHQGH